MILIAAACRKYSRGFRLNILTRNQKSPSVCKSTGLNARPRRLEPQSPGRPSDEPGLQAVHLEPLTATLFAVCTRVCVRVFASEEEPDNGIDLDQLMSKLRARLTPGQCRCLGEMLSEDSQRSDVRSSRDVVFCFTCMIRRLQMRSKMSTLRQ